MEWLRALDESKGDDMVSWAVETAYALSIIEEEELLVSAARRLVARNPQYGLAWWVAASILSSYNRGQEAVSIEHKLTSDPTKKIATKNIPNSAIVGVFAQDRYARESVSLRKDLLPAILNEDLGGSQYILCTTDLASSPGCLLNNSQLKLLKAAASQNVHIRIICPIGSILPILLYDKAVKMATGEILPTDTPGSILPRSRGKSYGQLDRVNISSVAHFTGHLRLEALDAAFEFPNAPELL
jgi:hypothetical protein